MAKFRKKPIIVEAEQVHERIAICTREGTLYAYPGDWIITGIEGERYPIGNSIFKQTYEPVDDDDEMRRRESHGHL